jgi:hypothetical protein
VNFIFTLPGTASLGKGEGGREVEWEVEGGGVNCEVPIKCQI